MLFVGGIIGWKYREHIAKKNIEHVVETLEPMVESYEEIEGKEGKVSRVIITEEGDQLLVHNADTHEFIIQGSSLEEIHEKIKVQYPDRYFIVDNSGE